MERWINEYTGWQSTQTRNATQRYVPYNMAIHIIQQPFQHK